MLIRSIFLFWRVWRGVGHFDARCMVGFGCYVDWGRFSLARIDNMRCDIYVYQVHGDTKLFAGVLVVLGFLFVCGGYFFFCTWVV